MCIDIMCMYIYIYYINVNIHILANNFGPMVNHVNHDEHAFFLAFRLEDKTAQKLGILTALEQYLQGMGIFRWMTKRMVEAPKKIMGCLPSINWCRISQPSTVCK